MDFKIMKCPVCGAPLDCGPDEKHIICRACDTPLRLNEDATDFLKDPEAFGYGFEKGRQRARAEEERRRSGERGSYYAGDSDYSQVPPRQNYQDRGYYGQAGPDQPYPGRMNYRAYAGMDPTVSDKDRWAALIICFFLGVVGGHQFYVGRFGKGLLYLFTGGLLGIGWLIDIISLIMGTFKDSQGRVLVGANERNNFRYGDPYGGSQPYGAPQRSYGGQPGHSRSANSRPGYENDAEWARKIKKRRKIFLGLTILFGISMLGNFLSGDTTAFGYMAIFTAVFGYLYYNTPRP